MSCPKCNGKIVPYTSAPDSDSHCLICGFYIAALVHVVMPGIPPKQEHVYSTDPRAIADREWRARRNAAGTPHRKRTASVNKEASHA